MQIRYTSDHTLGNGVKILVYGKAGIGKTRLCATCPAPIIISAESGLLSLRQYRIPYIPVTKIQDLRDAFRWASTSSESRNFQTICLDSISEIAEIVLAAAKFGKTDNRQAYGKLIEDMTGVIKEFRDLPRFHVYMSAKQETFKNDAGVMFTQPMMPGNKLGQAMPYFPDELFQLCSATTATGIDYTYLRTKPDFANEAKDRSGALDAVEEPHLGKIISKILGVAAK